MFSTRHIAAAGLTIALCPAVVAAQSGIPCEEYSASSAVFVGTAGERVKRVVQLPYHQPLEMLLTPIAVEQTYHGKTTRVMYITPAGVERYARPGERYLVYGRSYSVPDIVMASPGIGLKELGKAAEDLAFLASLPPGSSSAGTIYGEVLQREQIYGKTSTTRVPLARVPLRIFNDTHATEASTDENGRFTASGLPAGRYEIVPRFPPGLIVLDPSSKIAAVVGDGGCASVKIEGVYNGSVTGILRGPNGDPLRASVDLMPMDVEPDKHTGQITGTSSVGTNDKGEFVFTGRAPGRYYLGVSLYKAPNPNGPSYPRTYYPGTVDRAAAIPVVVEQGRTGEAYDFSIPFILQKGELEYVVDTQHAGALKFCFVQLEDLFSQWTSHAVKPGLTYRAAIVDGQRYEVHVHLEYPGGHLESEPFVFTATTGKLSVTLRPDAPRTLHR